MILFQDILCKIKTLLVDEKKHIRFGEWNANEVSTLIKYDIFIITFFSIVF